MKEKTLLSPSAAAEHLRARGVSLGVQRVRQLDAELHPVLVTDRDGTIATRAYRADSLDAFVARRKGAVR